MQSLKNRFKDKIPEVLEYTRQNGRWAAMEHFGIKDYVCFYRFLKEETDEPNFGVAPINRPTISYRPLDLQYMDVNASIPPLIKLIHRLERQVARKKMRRDELEALLREARDLPDEDWEPCEIGIEI